ncbi:MAG: polysaccharide deacetylase family protein [Rhodothermales bacterium]
MPEHDEERIFDGRRGAVSLTFDDGTANQLEKAIPPLDERDLRGTFYLNPRDRIMKQALSDWQAVAACGHEIGNHTLSHPCPSAITGGRGLEDMTIDELEADILAAQGQLQTIAPHQKVWTFAYPCYSTYVGRGAGRQSYVPVVARHFLAGRAGGEYGFSNRPDLLDPAALIGTPVERLTARETIELIQRLTGQGQWLVLVFHDIDGEVLSFAQDDYLVVLDFLAHNRDELLTASLVDVATLVARWQSKQSGIPQPR